MRGWVLFHRVSAAVWLVLLIPALLWWSESIAFVIVASVYANMKSDWGAAEAADDRRVVEALDRIEQVLVRLERAGDGEATQDLSRLIRDLPPSPRKHWS